MRTTAVLVLLGGIVAFVSAKPRFEWEDGDSEEVEEEDGEDGVEATEDEYTEEEEGRGTYGGSKQFIVREGEHINGDVNDSNIKEMNLNYFSVWRCIYSSLI